MAKLDRFKGRIPNLFENYLRIDHLDPAAARQAIEEPIAEYNRLQKDGKITIEPELVEAVLDQVKTGKSSWEKQDGAWLKAGLPHLMANALKPVPSTRDDAAVR